MYGLILWQLLEDRIRPFYPTAGRGRHPYPLSTMLRTHCVQLFYNLSDLGMEDLLSVPLPVAPVRVRYSVVNLPSEGSHQPLPIPSPSPPSAPKSVSLPRSCSYSLSEYS